MKVFLDTCALFKLYHNEAGKEEIEIIFTQNKVNAIFLSEITKIEFASAVWKRYRKGDINESQAKALISFFERDFGKFIFVPTDAVVIGKARELLSKYGSDGLRTLDSIQLSTAVLLSNQSDLFKTSDKLLKRFFISEGLTV